MQNRVGAACSWVSVHSFYAAIVLNYFSPRVWEAGLFRFGGMGLCLCSLISLISPGVILPVACAKCCILLVPLAHAVTLAQALRRSG